MANTDLKNVDFSDIEMRVLAYTQVRDKSYLLEMFRQNWNFQDDSSFVIHRPRKSGHSAYVSTASGRVSHRIHMPTKASTDEARLVKEILDLILPHFPPQSRP